jgi:hypothetical protein
MFTKEGFNVEKKKIKRPRIRRKTHQLIPDTDRKHSKGTLELIMKPSQ